MSALAEIANEIGNLTCRLISVVIPKCQTGQSVEEVGYAVAVLILFSLVAIRFFRNPRS
jgi:hypothetical protein